MTKIGSGNNGLPIEKPSNTNISPKLNNPVQNAVADNTRVVKPNLSNLVNTQNYQQSSHSPIHSNLPEFHPLEAAGKLVTKAGIGAVARAQANPSNRHALDLINNLKQSIGDPEKFANEVNGVLRNSGDRAALLKYFGLDSAQNKSDLGRAMFLEAGEGLNKDNMMPVGAVILNRALANNIALAATGSSKRISVADVIKERSARGAEEFSIRGSFTSGGGAIGRGAQVQEMVTDLLNGSAGSHGGQAANAFYFQRGRLGGQTFSQGGHNFSPKPWGTDYVNGNNLVHRGRTGYH